ncbi:MAG: UDPGP type 1 family protein, partial [Lentisphaerae bacterium]|nr:UDPGP type 1 family protein [Lentisphaerota bacterium]
MNWKETLLAHGQTRIAGHLEKIGPDSRARLEKQLAEIDFDELDSLIRQYVLHKPETAIPADLSPAPFFRMKPENGAQTEYYRKAEAKGRELLAAGKIALLVVAGGQGTRLGFDGPKGTYPICPVTGKTLFQYFAEEIGRFAEKYG